ncbi:expressed unknown protein [Seminavis robusta]|uniref:Mif2/CENP-C cupin domain-containing protein n=1 Tax=Seminavis robusta TaxID=568900 RepID=A0A9N8E5Q8_9STRA|nr:expressed unknown protein [Seminavis robusta]|eukprot:Sro648_g181020.1 n/a (787) ;mRNA; f:7800-10307
MIEGTKPTSRRHDIHGIDSFFAAHEKQAAKNGVKGVRAAEKDDGHEEEKKSDDDIYAATADLTTKLIKNSNHPRFSLHGAASIESEKNYPSTSTKRIRADAKKTSFSPSELSTVSTAPPTPAAEGDVGFKNSPLVTQHGDGEQDESKAQASVETEPSPVDHKQQPPAEEEEEQQQPETEEESHPEAEEEQQLDEKSRKSAAVEVEEEEQHNAEVEKPEEETQKTSNRESERTPSPTIEREVTPESPDTGRNEHDEEVAVQHSDDDDDDGFPHPGENNDSDDGGGFQLAGNDETPFKSLKVTENEKDNVEKTSSEDDPKEEELDNKKGEGEAPNSKSSKRTPSRKKKLARDEDEKDEGETLNSISTKRTPSRKKSTREDEEDDEGETRSSKSNKRTPSRKKKSTREEEVDAEEEEVDETSSVIHGADSPQTTRGSRSHQDSGEETKKPEKRVKSNKSQKGKAKKKIGSTRDRSQNSVTPETVLNKKKRKKVNFGPSTEGYPVGPRGYTSVSIEECVEDSGRTDLRRSRRARTQPLQYWKNERFVYGANQEDGVLGEAMGNMPVVNSILMAEETPYKKRKVTVKKIQKKKGGKKSNAADTDYGKDSIPFDDRKIKNKHHFLEGESALVWNDGVKKPRNEKVVSFSEDIARHPLPIPATRKKSDGKAVASAAQAFNIRSDENSENYVGYIMGHLALPPKALKDYESVGPCAQTFTVCHAQPNSVEVAYADPEEEAMFDSKTAQRFLLGPGDMFRVPQNNVYQIKNHSTNMKCLLTWTIIRPHDSHHVDG